MADTTIETDPENSAPQYAVRAGPVWVSETQAYFFYVDESGNDDIVYRKTVDEGRTWVTCPHRLYHSLS